MSARLWADRWWTQYPSTHEESINFFFATYFIRIIARYDCQPGRIRSLSLHPSQLGRSSGARSRSAGTHSLSLSLPPPPRGGPCEPLSTVHEEAKAPPPLSSDTDAQPHSSPAATNGDASPPLVQDGSVSLTGPSPQTQLLWWVWSLHPLFYDAHSLFPPLPSPPPPHSLSAFFAVPPSLSAAALSLLPA